MNSIKESLFVKLLIPEQRKTLICHLYRSLLKSVRLNKFISSDEVIKRYLTTQISLEFLEAKDFIAFDEIYKSYGKGLEILNLMKKCDERENVHILTDLAYGPRRFLKAFIFNYCIENKVGIQKAKKIVEEEIFDKRLGYNYAIPKEFLEYINSKPDEYKRFIKLCQPDFRNFFG